MADFRAAAAAGQCDIRWETLGRLLERVPSVTAVMGPTAGGSAARAVCAHFSLMSRPNGCLFGGGPPLVEYALGEKIDKFELGGHEVHTRGGRVDRQRFRHRSGGDRADQAFPVLPAEQCARAAPRARVDPDDAPSRDCDVLGVMDPERPRRAFDPRWTRGRVREREWVSCLSTLTPWSLCVLYIADLVRRSRLEVVP